ncbi:WecB/TagA/CpsF family glycosyltransferase [Photobacterium leiognathi]|uniref:WecB/TagA/CpsF family glycosyltransferase n=1 Tax=Photobacterium leiognathi TaxID=553611 RepID=UPI0015E645AE|nr:WecB/TagA/CpsF family glycosyltransferase [Photobacterium leiognathi]
MKIETFDISMLGKEKKLHTFVNPYSFYIFEKYDERFKDQFFIYSDGISLVKIHNFFKENNIKRCSFDFTSLAPIIFQYSIEKQLSIGLVGGTSDEVKVAASVLKSKYPMLNISFIHHGFIKGSEIDVINEMIELEVDIVIAGLGTPFQEEFISKCNQYMNSLKFAFTCGGFISQISVNENYFHPFFDKLHLRWAQRFVRHSYVRKRVLIDYPRFFIKYIWNNVNGK